MTTIAPPDTTDHTSAASRLLREAGVRVEHEPILMPVGGGANNRVFRVEIGDGRYLLKHYFTSPQDPRDRLGAEFSFLRFAWDHGLTEVPEPLGKDEATNLGLYRYLAGRPMRRAPVEPGHVRAAARFVVDLNRHRRDSAAANLFMASDACFTLRQHTRSIDRRIRDLLTIDPDTALAREALPLARGKLSLLWDREVKRVEACARDLGLDLDQPIEARDRVLSPSDFGFHNAILGSDGRVRFVDFEYAGWDDPAKLVADFFTQVDAPVPGAGLEGFVESLGGILADAGGFAARVRVLLPAYRLKWCSIVLGVFLPGTMQRRRFAGCPADQVESVMERQLDLARQLLQRT